MSASRLTLIEALHAISDRIPNTRQVIEWLIDPTTQKLRDAIAHDPSNRIWQDIGNFIERDIKNRTHDIRETFQEVANLWMAMHDASLGHMCDMFAQNNIAYFRTLLNTDKDYIHHHRDDINHRIKDASSNDMINIVEHFDACMKILPELSASNQRTVLYYLNQRHGGVASIFRIAATDPENVHSTAQTVESLFWELKKHDLVRAIMSAQIPQDPAWALEIFQQVWTREKIADALAECIKIPSHMAYTWDQKNLQLEKRKKGIPSYIAEELDRLFDRYKKTDQGMNAMHRHDVMYVRPTWIEYMLKHMKQEYIDNKILFAASSNNQWHHVLARKELFKTFRSLTNNQVHASLREYADLKNQLDLRNYRASFITNIDERAYYPLLATVLNRIIYQSQHPEDTPEYVGVLLTHQDINEYLTQGVSNISMMEAAILLQRLIPNASVDDVKKLCIYHEMVLSIHDQNKPLSSTTWKKGLSEWISTRNVPSAENIDFAIED